MRGCLVICATLGCTIIWVAWARELARLFVTKEIHRRTDGIERPYDCIRVEVHHQNDKRRLGSDEIA